MYIVTSSWNGEIHFALPLVEQTSLRRSISVLPCYSEPHALKNKPLTLALSGHSGEGGSNLERKLETTHP